MLGLPLIEASESARVYTVLGWRVEEIEATIAELEARGIEFNRYQGMGQDENGVWVAPGGTRVAWFGDPDGNTISVSQSP